MPFVYKTDSGRLAIEEAKRLILEAMPRVAAIDVWRRADGSLQTEYIDAANLQAPHIDDDFFSACQMLNIEPRWKWRPVLKGYSGEASQDVLYTITHDEFVRLAAQFDLPVIAGDAAPAVIPEPPPGVRKRDEPVDGFGDAKKWTSERRASLLAQFRALDGKRPIEPGKKGQRGALAALSRRAGIDKDTLGQQLDKAISEKADAARWDQLRTAE